MEYLLDYYRILHVQPEATIREINSAFETQVIAWHPDKYPEEDTTERINQLNEAKLILSDREAREKYDAIYPKFFDVKVDLEALEKNFGQAKVSVSVKDDEINDPDLSLWMENARIQAADYLSPKTIRDYKGLALSDVNKSIKEQLAEGVLGRIAFGFIIILFVFAIRNCAAS